MEHCVQTATPVAALDVNIDTIAKNIARMRPREKEVVSVFVAGKEAYLADLFGYEKASADAQVSTVLRRAGIPNFPAPARRLYLKAGGLQAIGEHEKAKAVVSRIAAQWPTLTIKVPLADRPRLNGSSLEGRRVWRATDDAFNKGIIACTTSLRSFAMSLCGNIDRAEDLVQETLVRALANRDSFEPGTNLQAWLFTILRNYFRSQYRKRRREVEDGEGHYAETLKTQPEQHGQVEFREFREALATLKPDHREALLLVGASGFSYDEAAAISKCAVGTIKSRVNRARTRLAELLFVECADEFGPDAPTRAVLNK